MKKVSVILLAVLVCFAIPLMAQEKEVENKEMPAPAPPPPISEDDFCKWMVGEWEGWSEGGPMGRVESSEKVEFGLNGQFLFRTAGDKAGYQGMGGVTMNPETKEFMGYWIDSFRGMYEGKGKRDGNTLSMVWTGDHGTYKQTTARVSNDKYTYTWSFTDPAGNTLEGTGEMAKKPPMTNKN